MMYAGRVVEPGRSRFFRKPRHAYTLGLLNSVPRAERVMRQPLASIPGQPP